MSDKCDKCKSVIRGESGYRCEGVCGRTYHSAVKCSGLDGYQAKVLGEHPMLKFICEECVTYIRNVDLILRDITESVNKNNRYLKEYKHEFGEALKSNRMVVEQLMGSLEASFNDRLASIKAHYEACIKIQKDITTSVSKMDCLTSTLNNHAANIISASEKLIAVSNSPVPRNVTNPIFLAPMSPLTHHDAIVSTANGASRAVVAADTGDLASNAPESAESHTPNNTGEEPQSLEPVGARSSSHNILDGREGCPSAHREVTAVPPRRAVFVSRLHSSLTEDDIIFYIKSKLESLSSKSCDINIIVYKFNFKQVRDISSFKISVPDSYVDELLNPSFWPVHSVVHLFTNKSNNLPASAKNSTKNSKKISKN